MIKKSFILRNVAIIACLVGVTVFTSCKPDEPKGNEDTNTPAKIGVKINGVVWSPYNVGATGAFVSAPENYGRHYQWNRKDTDNFLLNEDYFASTYPTATSWLPANNPCPKGWRIPTYEEFESLLDTDKVTFVWTTANGINGGHIVDITSGSSIFLPAAGYRYFIDMIFNVGEYAYYWGSTEIVTDYACALVFGRSSAVLQYPLKKFGFSVRCVAE